MKMVMLFLACSNEKEADRISNTLLNKRLAACTKKLPVSSLSWWKGELEKSHETLLLIETIAEKFEQIEKEVKKLHSYELPGLLALPVVKATPEVKKWLKESMS